MLIGKIKGGLGNQMFQYAYIRALSLRINKPFLLDTTEYDYYKYRDYELSKIFDIKSNFCKGEDLSFYQRLYSKNRYLNFLCTKIKSICIKLNPHHYVEKNILRNKTGEHSIIDDKFLHIKEGYIEGYFQSEKYFLDFADEIRKDFVFKKPISRENEKIKYDIENSESVCVHVRRGDYLKHIDTYRVCDVDYFEKGIKIIETKLKTVKFFIFSDDIAWCKRHLTKDNAVYVAGNIGSDAWQDMYLMSCCRHNIISNSSFSWWGGRLNKNLDKIVIAPQKWFINDNVYQNDIVPDSRIKI